MSFTLLPAVDIASAQAVRLTQGQADTATTSGDPLTAARAWQNNGAEWLHLVDLDAAFGRGSNAELLASVVEQLDIKVEVSGGIHDDASLDWALSTECERVILSTTAIENPSWCARSIATHGERIAIALDVQIAGASTDTTEHRLAARGRPGDVGELWETLHWLDQQGCARYIVTDVSKDGMLNGPNLDLYRRVTSATAASVIASGGVSAIADLLALSEIAKAEANLEGSIIGKALYAGRFTLPQAIEAVSQI